MAGPLRQGHLESGEWVRGRWAAAIPSPGGWVARLRGDLILTDRRLLFDPADIRHGLSPLAAPAVSATVRSLLRPVPLAEIVAVRALPGRPARARLDTRRGSSVVAVLGSPQARTWGRASRVARDAFVEAVDAALDI